MQPNEKIHEGNQFEAVIGVFNTPEDASRVAASLRGPELDVQRVSRQDPTAAKEMPKIVYDSIEKVTAENVTGGMLQGGAIGAGSGLLLLGIPGLNILAPIAGAIAGAFIGGVAGIDEANRGIELPKQADYQRMLADGKSFLVIAGNETIRIEYGNMMMELGATDVHQHPPVLQTLRTGDSN